MGVVLALLFVISAVTGAQRVFAPVSPLSPPGPDDILVGGTRLKLEPPNGFCALDSKRDDDGRVLNVIQQRSPPNFLVVRGFVKCETLTELRSGKAHGTDDSVGAITVKQEHGRVVTAGALMRADYLSAVEKTGTRVDIDQISRDLAERLSRGQSPGNSAFGGIIQRDDAAVYIATVGTSAGEIRPYLALGAITVLGSQPLVIALLHVADDSLNARSLLSTQVQYAHFLLRSNSDLDAAARSGITTYRSPIYVGDIVLLLSAIGLIAVFAWPKKPPKQTEPQQFSIKQ